MNKEEKEKALRLLNDTAKHYNLSNRSALKDCTTCYYVAPEEINSEGCAIGRCLTDEAKAHIKEHGGNTSNVSDLFSELSYHDIELGEKLEGICEDFLTDVQQLHDTSSNWDDEGLSANGLNQFRALKRRYELEEK